ncbi:MAG: hypothetical protein R3E53_01680 [Myxococcota bacterium]
MGVLGRWRRDLGFLRTLGPVALDGLRLAPDRKVELSDLLARHFRKRRDRVALVDEERTLTWGELDLEANRWRIGRSRPGSSAGTSSRC